MACSQNISGIAKDCTRSKGGISEVYIRNWEDDIYVEEGGVITEASRYGWKVYSFKKNSGSMTSTLTIDAVNGVNYVETELSLVFARMETAKRIELSKLAKAETAIIVKDCNGNYFALGFDAPVTVSSGTGQTGTQFGDGNNYTLTLNDQSKTFPYLLTDALGEKIESIAKGVIPIEDVHFTQNPRTTTLGSHSITYQVMPSDETEGYTITSSDNRVINIDRYSNGICYYTALKSGSAVLFIQGNNKRYMHSVNIYVEG